MGRIQDFRFWKKIVKKGVLQKMGKWSKLCLMMRVRSIYDRRKVALGHIYSNLTLLGMDPTETG